MACTDDQRSPVVVRSGVWRNLLCCSLTLAGIAICTWVSFRLGQGFAFTGFIYLVFVVLTAMYGGFQSATLVSVASAACLNYFFVPPIFSFVNSPENWVALGAFEFTALVISQLSHREHQRTSEVEHLYEEMERLYQTSRRILLLDSSAEPGAVIASAIRETFQLKAVQLFDALPVRVYCSGECPADVEARARDAYLLSRDTFDSATGSWYCVLGIGARPIGSLALTETGMTKATATALASLSAIALERARILQNELRAHADRQTEQLRGSVLDNLAHQFKTPLAVARTASAGLFALGGLSELQTDLVAIIDQQARKLDDLASRLLRSASLEKAEFKPKKQALLLSALAHSAVSKLESATDRERVRVFTSGGEPPVLADQDLILTSISQLVDNAINYSNPGSPIDISLTFKAAETVLTVKSKGLVVADADRERIFERFYRAPETRHLTSGTGLGLSIVKKIVESHGGHVWAVGAAGDGTAVSISLPTAPAPIYDYAMA
jgi:two-component system, OmpR family, sensor histidine kinase KdpD